VLSRAESYRNSLAKEFVAVPGMAKFYQQLDTALNTLSSSKAADKKFAFPPPKSNTLFVYLTASPIFLADQLYNFFNTSGFLIGPMLMANTALYDVIEMHKLSDLVEYKVGKAKPLLQDFPDKNWVMVGDSGQMDPVVYATLYRDLKGIPQPNAGESTPAAKNAAKKICIYIRAVSGVDATKEAQRNDPRRFVQDFVGVPPENWVVFSDASELAKVDPTKGCYPPGVTNPMPKKAEALKAEAALQEEQEEQTSSFWLTLSDIIL